MDYLLDQATLIARLKKDFDELEAMSSAARANAAPTTLPDDAEVGLAHVTQHLSAMTHAIITSARRVELELQGLRADKKKAERFQLYLIGHIQKLQNEIAVESKCGKQISPIRIFLAWGLGEGPWKREGYYAETLVFRL